MADRIGVMRAGRMVQVGTPREIFETPANRFVAEFMGMANLWDGIVRADGLTMEVSEHGTIHLAAAVSPGAAVLGVRAERIVIGAVPGMNQMTGVAERSAYAGDTITHTIRVGPAMLVQMTEPAHGAASREGPITVSFPPSACMVFPA